MNSRRAIRVKLGGKAKLDDTSVLAAVDMLDDVNLASLQSNLASLNVEPPIEVSEPIMQEPEMCELAKSQEVLPQQPLVEERKVIPTRQSRSRSPSRQSGSSRFSNSSRDSRSRSRSPDVSPPRRRVRSYRSRSKSRERRYSPARSFPVNMAQLLQAFVQGAKPPGQHHTTRKQPHTIVKRNHPCQRPQPRQIHLYGNTQQFSRRSNSFSKWDQPPPIPPPIRLFHRSSERRSPEFRPQDTFRRYSEPLLVGEPVRRVNTTHVIVIVNGMERAVMADLKDDYSCYDHAKRVWHVVSEHLGKTHARDLFKDVENVINEMMSGEEIFQAFCGWLRNVHDPQRNLVAITRMHQKHSALSVQSLCGAGAVFVNSWPRPKSTLLQNEFLLPPPKHRAFLCHSIPPIFTNTYAPRPSSLNYDRILVLLGSPNVDVLEVFAQAGYCIFSKREPFEKLVRSLWEYIPLENEHVFWELVATAQERIEAQCLANRVNLFEWRFAQWEQERRKQGSFFQVVLVDLHPVENAELIQRFRARGAKTCAKEQKSLVPVDMLFTSVSHLKTLI